MLYVENGPRGNCAWAWISLRLRLIIIQPKADTYFTAPRRVEDWFDVGNAEEYAVRAQGCSCFRDKHVRDSIVGPLSSHGSQACVYD